MPCVTCGYNLRGLTLEKVCPECATPAGKSVHGNLLRYADPHWLGKLRLGTALMLWNILVIIVLSIGTVVLSGLGLPGAVSAVALTIASALGLWAVILVTTQEPRISLVEDAVTLRAAVRICALADFIGGIGGAAAEHLGGGSVVGVVSSVLNIVGLVSVFGLFVYFRRFARRIPDEKLARSTTIVMWGFVIGSALVTAGALIGVLTVLGTPGATLTTAAAGAPGTVAFAGIAIPVGAGFLCGGLLALMVFGIWYLFLLFRYHRAFRPPEAALRDFLAAGAARNP